MKIFINDEELNTSIDTEETLGDVYTEIRKWAESQGKFLLTCLVDGNEKLESELNHLSINAASRLDFYVGENMDILISSLIELDKYVDVVGNTLFGRDSLTEKENRDLRDGVQWIKEVLEAAKNLLHLDYSTLTAISEGNNIDAIIATTVGSVNHLDSVSKVESYLENLRDLKLFIMNLINKTSLLTVDINTLEEVVRAYSENMEVLKKEFIRVNENFQSGKDILAGELLSHSIGRLEILLNALISLKSKFPDKNLDSIKVGENTLEATVEKLHSLMKEVANSFEKNDIVMAGDLLEYELPEILEQFVPYLKEIGRILGK
jgi:hypothetical protein